MRRWGLIGLAGLAVLGLAVYVASQWLTRQGAMSHAQAAENALVIGQPDAETTVVEFVDYQCHLCPILNQRLMAAVGDRGVRIVVRPLPWLTSDSGRVAILMMFLQVSAPTQAEKLHAALMERTEPADYAETLALAAELGIDTGEASHIQENPDLIRRVQKNLDLARALKLQSVPAILLGGTVYAPTSEHDIPNVERLQTLLDQERKDPS